ncbi:LysR family transcriptional regulator [Microlunatus ginsengisoli]|uniref:LysR family transcriptional regulator n=1 Tax=Microlunatus ginsengisoli TaxID=363863 RepID=A0ABP6ZY01_9ACTN
MSETVDIRLLRTLVEVHRTGSLTAAATVLDISQPAVTGQLQALERQLGRPLFVRAARGVVPTALGDLLATESAPHVDALQRIVGADLRSEPSIAGRTLALGGPAEFVSQLVVPALTPLLADGLRIRVVHGLPDDLLGSLHAGHLDLVVLTTRPPKRRLHTVALCDEELVLVAPPDFDTRVAVGGDPSPVPPAVSASPMVAYAETMPLIRRYWSFVFGSRPPGPPALVVPDLRAVLAAVAAGAGISVLPGYLCAQAIRQHEVTVPVEPEIPPINTLHLAIAAGRAAQPHIARAAETLLAAARSW